MLTLPISFNPMLKSLKGGAGRVFNHNEIIDYYSECFVGREDESNKIILTGTEIFNDEYVTTGNGTGIVHTAPSFGEDDNRWVAFGEKHDGWKT